MISIHPPPFDETIDAPPGDAPPHPAEVMLADGRRTSLDGLSTGELHQLQWEQEQRFADAIRACPPRSRERNLVTATAYDTISTILAAQSGDASGELIMGMDPRYARLVLEVLDEQIQRGLGNPAVFEVGYGSGALLEEVRGHGFPAGGVEISEAMREQAVARLGEQHSDKLLLGDVRDVAPKSLSPRPSLIFWNDVFEHIPVDEIDEYVAHLYKLLLPRGTLITITPHWLLRPSDVTGDFCPPRTEPRGLHLKEYRLREATAILRRAGFRSIATPLFATKGRLIVSGGGGRWLKQLVETPLDRLPVRMAHLLCRGLAMSCTLATK